jgi:hypothetical protein
MWSIWPSYQKPLLLSRIFRNKKSEKERCTFRGVVKSAHFSSHDKKSYPIFAYTGKHLTNYSQKLSIISKQSKLIPKELRYQEKIHAIIWYAKRKKYPANSPQFFIFYLLKKCNMEMTSYARQDQTWWCQYRKTVAWSVFPQQVPAMLSQENRGHNKLVPHGVNGLILLDPHLFHPWRWFAGHVHVGHTP